MISAGGKQFQDWSAIYRMFEKERIEQRSLFAPVITNVLEMTKKDDPLFIIMDDTLIRKRGKKVSGAGWKRDPLGPPFHTNFVWGQRYLQISTALPDHDISGRARGIPVEFHHSPSPTKPRKNSSPEAWAAYREQQKKCRISTVGAARLAELREQVPDRKIVCAVDGGFTNKEIFTLIPDNTVIIGRIRKDARLFKVPEESEGAFRGRKKYYGDPLPTPEQIRQDEKVPWQKVNAFAAGKYHEFDVKTIFPVRWQSSKNRDVLIVIIRPLAYRPSNGAKLLYRDPAYLICSDPELPLEQLIQAYIWRWEIELNFRDEKHVMGVGEAQVRTPSAVQAVPAFIVASYAFLLLAAHSIKVNSSSLPPPKWYRQEPTGRVTTQKIISIFRSQFWKMKIDLNKSGFDSQLSMERTPFNSNPSVDSAVCYAVK